jgi:chromosome partitioning protein
LKIITFSSLKGGVGKTTATSLTAAASADNKKVLVIDLDANNNLTDFFLRNADPLEILNRNIYHILKSAIAPENAIYSSDVAPLDIIPAAPILSRITAEANGDPGVILRFASKIKKLDYDCIFIDTPPALGLELRAALYASDLVIVPVSFNRWIIQGFDLVADEIQQVQEAIGKSPKLMALPTMVSDSENEKLRTSLPDLPYLNSFIPKNSAIKNAGTTAILPKVGSIAETTFKYIAQEALR